jgi:hypothetical protein
VTVVAVCSTVSTALCTVSVAFVVTGELEAAAGEDADGWAPACAGIVPAPRA